MTKEAFKYVVIPAVFCVFLVFLAGCSGKKEAEQAETTGKSATEQTVEAVRGYGKRPIDRARAAQGLAQERTKAIDEAIKTK